ncbi:MAG: CoB--CoM heterodisulfide reductase iron-sulfur subunit B family protein [Beijerinckiaceae bacterium]
MKLSYFPGCTMKSHAANFEESLLFSMRHLGDEVEEIDRWNCCGVTLSLAQDNAMRQLAPIRNLIRVKEADSTRVMTACAMCYNTLKRANDLVRADPALRQRMNTFMYDEKVSYEGDVDVIHVLEALRQKEGFETIRAKVAKPLKGLRVASYYGCLLVRPRSVAFDNVENPVLLDELATALGATAVDFSHKTECCGSYQTVNKPEITADRAFEILTAAHDEGAEIIAVSCPLCAFNLDHRQKLARDRHPGFRGLPVVYFSQLMAIAFGGDESVLKLELHRISPRPLLAAKGLL